MRVGYLGDIYKVSGFKVNLLVDYCVDKELDLLIFCGGISKDYENTLEMVNKVGDLLSKKGILFRFIVGNTDLYYSDESVVDKEKKIRGILSKYNENKYSLITHPIMTHELVILGCNTWYDYSFYRGRDTRLSDITCKSKYFIKCDDVKYITDADDYTLGLKNTFDYRYTRECNSQLLSRLQDNQRKYGSPVRCVVVSYFKPHKAFLDDRLLDNYFGTFQGNVDFSKILSNMRVNYCKFGMTSDKKYAKIDNVNYTCCSIVGSDGMNGIEVDEYA